MAGVQKGRFTADVDSLGGEVVVFLIGMRINSPGRCATGGRSFMAMPRMLKELERDPEIGLLGFEQALLALADHRAVLALVRGPRRYARNHDRLHWPAWRRFNQRVARLRHRRDLARDLPGRRRAHTRRSTATCRPSAWPRRPPGPDHAGPRLSGRPDRGLRHHEPALPAC